MHQVGDVVSWRSQSNGIWKTKTGVIVEVFEFRGKPRYKVGVKSERGIMRYYTPWASQLRKVD